MPVKLTKIEIRHKLELMGIKQDITKGPTEAKKTITE
jgi:hypothetical protein